MAAAAAKKRDDLPPGVLEERPAAPAGAIDRGSPPPHGTARPAETGALPRVISPLERAGDGARRYKVRCNNYTPRPIRYILARSEQEAREHYLTVATDLSQVLARLERTRRDGDLPVEPADLVVTVLPD